MEKTEILQGTLQMLILKTLVCGRMHGYEISEYILRTSNEALKVEEGALYPALHRLELRGLVSAEWGVSTKNRRARYYQLTQTGRKVLREETKNWSRLSNAISLVLEGA
jgi:transcriptional regulator